MENVKTVVALKDASPLIQSIAQKAGTTDVEEILRFTENEDLDMSSEDQLVQKFVQQKSAVPIPDDADNVGKVNALMSEHQRKRHAAFAKAQQTNTEFVEPEMSDALKALIAQNQDDSDDVKKGQKPATVTTTTEDASDFKFEDVKEEDFAGNEKALKLFKYAQTLQKTHQDEIAKYGDFVTAVKEYEKNPQAFVLKYLPEYIANIDSALHKVDYEGSLVSIPKEQFDKLVAAKFIDENGKTLIKIDPVKAGLPGTDDYNYTKLLQEGAGFVEKARTSRQALVDRIQNETKENEAKFAQRLTEAKTKFTKEYGKDEKFFDEKVLPRLKNLSSLDIMNFVNAIPEVIELNVEKRVAERLKNNDISSKFKSGQNPITKPSSQFTTKGKSKMPNVFSEIFSDDE